MVFLDLCKINGSEDSAPLLGHVREVLGMSRCLRCCVLLKAGFVETTCPEICTDLLKSGLVVSRCPWHKNYDALQKISVFHTLYLLTCLVSELSWVPKPLLACKDMA